MSNSEPESSTDLSSGWRLLYSWPLRFAAFTLATVIALVILFLPQVVASTADSINHVALSLCLWGVSAGFVYGIGYVPKLLIWRILFGPLVAFPAMAIGVIEWAVLN